MTRFSIKATTTLALSLMPSTALMAQEEGVDVLSRWAYDSLYADGWSVERMFDEADIIDANGADIGDVENVIFNNDGEVAAIIAQVGGVWDIGDTHVLVPWNEVTIENDIDQVRVPITEDTVDDYDVFGNGWFDDEIITSEDTGSVEEVDDDLVAGVGVFKATDLIGDYSYLQENVRYGLVTDLIVQDGAISAIMVDARSYGRPGYYAYPYDYRGDMSTGRYDMPYTPEQIATIENFDYSQMQSRSVE